MRRTLAHFRTTGLLVATLAWAWCAAGLGAELATGAPETKTLLLVDDHHVLYRPETMRVLHSPRRHPENPLVRQSKPWEAEIGYASVYRQPDTGRYQLWYQAYAGDRPPARPLRCVVAYAESDDGIHWVKPKLAVHPFGAVKDTNIVLVGNGGRSVNYGASVVVDPRDRDAGRRYKMAYWDFVEGPAGDLPGLCVAFSADGIHWNKYGKSTVLPGSYGDPGPPPFDDQRLSRRADQPLSVSDVIDAMYDPLERVFAIYAKTWIDGPDGAMYWKRAVVRTQSADFVHWSRPELVIAPDESEVPQNSDARSIQLHSGPVFYHAGVYFSLLQVLDLTGRGTMPGELAISRDGRRWSRPFRGKYFLPLAADPKQFDAGCLWTNATPVVLEDEIRFYYGAYPSWNAGDQPNGIGVAILPRDRFAGLRPLDRVGQVTTKALDLGGVRQIALNADAAQGEVRVELLTEDGYRVRGYAADDALVIRGDSLRHPVRWKQKTLQELPAGRYLLRLHLNNAEVFAINLEATQK